MRLQNGVVGTRRRSDGSLRLPRSRPHASILPVAITGSFFMVFGNHVGSLHGFFRPDPDAPPPLFFASGVSAFFCSLLPTGLAAAAAAATGAATLTPFGTIVGPPSMRCPTVLLNTLSFGFCAGIGCRCFGGAEKAEPQFAARLTQEGYLE